MDPMFWAGTACWVFEGVALLWFLYECRDETTKKGYFLKGAVALNIIIYAVLLIIMNGDPFTRPQALFLVGLVFTFLGDMGLATMQLQHGGSSKAIFSRITADKVTIETLTAGVVGVLFIISFFFQLVAFLKGIHGDVQEFLIPFLIFFLLPPSLALVGGLMSQTRFSVLSTNVFIIALFYVLLSSAFFASASIYSFWLYREDPNHAIFVFSGAVMFSLSVLMIALRYSKPDRFETRSIRAVSRTLNYLARMILAGCAFLF